MLSKEGIRELFQIKIEHKSYREIAFFWMNVVGVILICPFNLNNLLYERYMVFFAGCVVALIFIVNTYTMSKSGRILINAVYSSIPVIIAVWIITYKQGLVGGFWAYPVLIWLYFSHDHRTSTIFNITFLAGLLPIIFYKVELDYAVRNAATILLTGILANIFSRIVENQQIRLSEMTIKDHLTGVFNRRHMDECISEFVHQNSRSNIPYAMAVLDIDHFKQINDKFGHAAGDETIKKVAQVCMGRIRKVDRMFRIGGEEFIILYYNVTIDDAIMITGECKKLIEKSEFIKKHKVTISCGVSELKKSDDIISWMKRCDKALYQAKESGRNKVVYL